METIKIETLGDESSENELKAVEKIENVSLEDMDEDENDEIENSIVYPLPKAALKRIIKDNASDMLVSGEALAEIMDITVDFVGALSRAAAENAKADKRKTLKARDITEADGERLASKLKEYASGNGKIVALSSMIVETLATEISYGPKAKGCDCQVCTCDQLTADQAE